MGVEIFLWVLVAFLVFQCARYSRRIIKLKRRQNEPIFVFIAKGEKQIYLRAKRLGMMLDDCSISFSDSDKISQTILCDQHGKLVSQSTNEVPLKVCSGDTIRATVRLE